MLEHFSSAKIVVLFNIPPFFVTFESSVTTAGVFLAHNALNRSLHGQIATLPSGCTLLLLEWVSPIAILET